VSANRTPPKYIPIALDVSSLESVEAAAATVEKEFGRCDIIVNNAGTFGDFSLVGDYDPESWSNVFDVNLRGPYLVTRALLPLMIKTGDAYVVNVASVGALLTGPTLSAYQISKTALFRLSDFINKEYSEKGVTSFAVHPGNCITDMAVSIGVDQNPLYKEGSSFNLSFSTPSVSYA
jgi:NAD(P)-dependent dehydrogenase (short-subunit alcohol dehydrogenase family)